MAQVMTGAEMVVQAMRDQGVEVVFGYPGGAVLPIYDAIFQQNDIRHVIVRHEQGALHAADGYARASGRTAARRCRRRTTTTSSSSSPNSAARAACSPPHALLPRSHRP